MFNRDYLKEHHQWSFFIWAIPTILLTIKNFYCVPWFNYYINLTTPPPLKSNDTELLFIKHAFLLLIFIFSRKNNGLWWVTNPFVFVGLLGKMCFPVKLPYTPGNHIQITYCSCFSNSLNLTLTPDEQNEIKNMKILYKLQHKAISKQKHLKISYTTAKQLFQNLFS